MEALALALDHHQMLALKVHQLHGSVKDAAVSFSDNVQSLLHSQVQATSRDITFDTSEIRDTILQLGRTYFGR